MIWGQQTDRKCCWLMDSVFNWYSHVFLQVFKNMVNYMLGLMCLFVQHLGLKTESHVDFLSSPSPTHTHTHTHTHTDKINARGEAEREREMTSSHVKKKKVQQFCCPALNEHSVHHKAPAAPWLSFHARTSLKSTQRLNKKTGPNVSKTHFLSPLLSISQPPEETRSGDSFSAAAHSFLLCVVWVELDRTDPLSHINISRTCGGNTQWKSRVLLTADSKRTRTREQLTASKWENKKVMKKNNKKTTTQKWTVETRGTLSGSAVVLNMSVNVNSQNAEYTFTYIYLQTLTWIMKAWLWKQLMTTCIDFSC